MVFRVFFSKEARLPTWLILELRNLAGFFKAIAMVETEKQKHFQKHIFYNGTPCMFYYTLVDNSILNKNINNSL